MKNGIKEIERLISIVKELREKCPWDKKQTTESLRTLTIEEAYELSESIISKNNKNIEEELGDLLLHVLFYAQMGSEKQLYNLDSICKKISKKLIERHPHIYGTKKVKNAREVEENWESIKQKKRKNKGILINIPKSIPPMVKAMRIQEKVKSVGFDWDKKEEVIEKVYEEIKELEEELNVSNQKKVKEELGDLIFSIINMARFINIDPEEALESTNIKFINRFQYMEEKITKDKKNLKEMSLDEMNKYWNSSKKIHG
tara:strand:+ start:926 stop:1699 length:774 start_codon:yes stop_codon:yes gene_type:complete